MKLSQEFREQYLQDMMDTATQEDMEQVEEIQEILRTVPVSTLMEFMVHHPEYEERSLQTLSKYMQFFPESSFMEAAVYTAAAYYHRHHKDMN